MESTQHTLDPTQGQLYMVLYLLGKLKLGVMQF